MEITFTVERTADDMVVAALNDPDDLWSPPMAEASGHTADEAMSNLLGLITLNDEVDAEYHQEETA